MDKRDRSDCAYAQADESSLGAHFTRNINPSGFFYLNSLDRPFPVKGVSGLFLLLRWFTEIPVLNANSIGPDQTPRFAASDQGLHCLPMSLLWNARLKWVNSRQRRIKLLYYLRPCSRQSSNVNIQEARRVNTIILANPGFRRYLEYSCKSFLFEPIRNLRLTSSLWAQLAILTN